MVKQQNRQGMLFLHFAASVGQIPLMLQEGSATSWQHSAEYLTTLLTN